MQCPNCSWQYSREMNYKEASPPALFTAHIHSSLNIEYYVTLFNNSALFLSVLTRTDNAINLLIITLFLTVVQACWFCNNDIDYSTIRCHNDINEPEWWGITASNREDESASFGGAERSLRPATQRWNLSPGGVRGDRPMSPCKGAVRTGRRRATTTVRRSFWCLRRIQ